MVGTAVWVNGTDLPGFGGIILDVQPVYGREGGVTLEVPAADQGALFVIGTPVDIQGMPPEGIIPCVIIKLAAIVNVHLHTVDPVGPVSSGCAPAVDDDPIVVVRVRVIVIIPHNQHRVSAALICDPGMTAIRVRVPQRAFGLCIPEGKQGVPIRAIGKVKAEEHGLV